MSTRQQKKVRYVKCPKCARILPEPEQVPLYTCGGCNTVLQAKYYRRDKEATVPTLPTEDVQSNGNGHTGEVQLYSGSSQRSPIKNEEIDEEPDDDCSFEGIGGGISARQLFGVLGNKGGKQVIISSGESGEISHEVKEAEQLPTENETKEGGYDQGQCDGVAFEKQGDEQVRDVNYSSETSTRREVELPENTKPQQPVTVNEVKEDKDDEQQQCEDIALDKQKEVGHENSANESSRSIQSEPTEKPTQFGPVNVLESSRVSGNEVKCLAVDEPIAVTKLGKEDKSGKEPKSFIERIKEKLAGVTSSTDAPLSTDVQDGTDNSLSGVEANLGTHTVHSISDVALNHDSEISLLDIVTGTSRPKIENFDGSDFDRSVEFVDSNEKVGNLLEEVPQDRGCEISLPDNVTETSRPKTENFVDSDFNGSGEFIDTSEKVGNLLEEVPLDLDCEISLLDKLTETSRPKIENFDESNFHRSGEFVDGTNEKGGNLVKEVTQSPIKRPPAYGGSVSSFYGNDDRFPGQLKHLNGETFSENDAVAAYVGIPSSRRKHSNSRTRAQVQEQESVRENDIPGYNRPRQHKNGIFPPRIPVHRGSSDMAFETGSSSSYVRDEGPRQHRRENETYGQLGYTEGIRFPETAWRENDFRPPMYYSDDISGEIHREYNDRIRWAESRSLSGNRPRIRFSGEVYDGRNQYHDGRLWSAHLPSRGPPRPPRGAYYRHGPIPYMDPSIEATWDRYDPYMRDSRRYLDFESYGVSHNAVYLSDDQRHKDWITKRSYMREKQQAMKRRLRPMAGGAPFIACSFCFRVLQLPEEFRASKQKKIHRLKCGACSNILEFSLGNESSLVSRIPSTVEDDRENQSTARQSQTNGKDLHQHNSFRALGSEKSNSRTGEIVEETYDGNDAAFSSNQPRQAGVTWRLPSRSKSPLHRLMGYSSPQDLVKEHTGYSS